MVFGSEFLIILASGGILLVVIVLGLLWLLRTNGGD